MSEITIKIQEELLEKIKSISKKQIITPTIPIAIYLQEAENLAVWAKDDMDQLSKVGITSTQIEDVKERIEACRLLQTEWMKLKKIKPEKQALLEENKQLAIEMRHELIFIYKYAFRNEEQALKVLKQVKKKNKTADLVATMFDLIRIGNTHTKLLEKISFEFNQLDDANKLAFKLQKQHSIFVASTPDKVKVKFLRDQSYTYLKLLLDEIKNAGKYVFAKNKERLSGYHSMYYKNKKSLINNTEHTN
ncbi:hypothetical protein [Marinifilum sp.]|uniref:hypothetical protein n=1 Tax=Marinifilum sp. TaxID=2033137 RepID=UPI003BABE3AB